MVSMEIERANADDVDALMDIFAKARRIMRESGNDGQWTNGYPQRTLVERCIAKGCTYKVLGEDGIIHGTFYMALEDDHTYHVIENGGWMYDEPYAVMYLADSGELLDQAIELLSKKIGLKIVHICGFKKKCYCDYFIKDAGPEEILGYILHADFVLSASFHATMFSLMFQKQFATLLPREQTNARINDLLEYVGLENRVIHCKEELIQLENEIDYFSADQVIKDFREESRAALLRALSEIAEG